MTQEIIGKDYSGVGIPPISRADHPSMDPLDLAQTQRGLELVDDKIKFIGCQDTAMRRVYDAAQQRVDDFFNQRRIDTLTRTVETNPTPTRN